MTLVDHIWSFDPKPGSVTTINQVISPPPHRIHLPSLPPVTMSPSPRLVDQLVSIWSPPLTITVLIELWRLYRSIDRPMDAIDATSVVKILRLPLVGHRHPDDQEPGFPGAVEAVL